MNNLDYFKRGALRKETLIDPCYHLIVDRQVIPSNAAEENALTRANSNVIRYISSVETCIYDLGKSVNDEEVVRILELIMDELAVKGMNLSAFCQYFNVHNMNYSVFSKLEREKKLEALKYLVLQYIEARHEMYLSHGYSNMVLQVMSDNYSHKRKGTYGTSIIVKCLEAIGIHDLTKLPCKDFGQDAYYLLSDKTGKKLYRRFAEQYHVRLSADGKETEKYPDALIKIGNDFFIVEQKNMKESGGGQDKQTLEITEFIDRKPEFEGLHYITFVDGIYFNRMSETATAKTHSQYQDIIKVLSEYPENYFVNSFAFEQLMKDCYSVYPRCVGKHPIGV